MRKEGLRGGVMVLRGRMSEELVRKKLGFREAMDLKQAMAGFSPLSLEGLDRVRLQSRVDTKYFLRPSQLSRWLLSLSPHYSCLEVDGIREFSYRTNYFDTADRDMYRAHHDGRRSRFKVRKRLYLESGDTFLEIKEKTNRGRTRKSRLPLSGASDQASLSDVEAAFLAGHAPYDPDRLAHVLTNSFARVTLSDRLLTERVTIDGKLGWSAPSAPGGEERWVAAPSEFFIVEVKRSKAAAASIAVATLEQARVWPVSFSKYCVGAAFLDQRLKRNLFKEGLRRMMA